MAYSFYASITVDNTKVEGTANISNFVMHFRDTLDGTGGEPDLRVTGSGGEIQNTDATGGASGALTVPADLAFFSDVDLTTQLDHEIIEYTTTTGLIAARVRIPTLDYNDDTVIYMAYGDTGVTTSQENIAGAWTDYEGVWHFAESGTGTRYDSANSNDTTTEANVTAGTGTLHANAIEFNGTSTKMVVDHHASLQITGGFTFMGWIYTDAAKGSWHRLVAKDWSTATTEINYLISVEGANNRLVFSYMNTSAAVQQWWTDTNGFTESQWNFCSVSFTFGTGSSLSVRINKTAPTGAWSNGDGDSATNTYSQPLGFGAKRFVSAPSDWVDGLLQTVRLRASTTSDDEVDTYYNNENSPSTFYTVGSETAVPASGIAASKRIIN